MIKSIAGGFLAQTKDNITVDKENLKVVTNRQPSEQELDDLLFAFRVAKHVKSNAIVYAKDGSTVGIGAGQMNRLDSSRIAARKSDDAAKMIKLEETEVKLQILNWHNQRHHLQVLKRNLLKQKVTY